MRESLADHSTSYRNSPSDSAQHINLFIPEMMDMVGNHKDELNKNLWEMTEFPSFDVPNKQVCL